MASGQINPIDNPGAWDFLTVGGMKSPGLAKVGEAKRANEWDKKKGKGASGESLTFVQKPAASFSVQFYLWEPQHFADWETFRPLLKYDPTKRVTTALDVYHPSLADLDIGAVVTESLGSIVHEGDQLYSCTVEFCEYNPPPPVSAVSTPAGSVGQSPDAATAGTQPDPAVVSAQSEFDSALADAKNLGPL